MGCAASTSGSAPTPRLETRRVESDYAVGSVIGRGTFCICKQATSRKTKAQVALKVISKANKDFNQKTISKEISVMQKIQHPGCIRLYDQFEDSSAIYIVQEIALGGDLFDRIKAGGQLNEENASFVLRQMLNALSYLHSHNICHRDLKPENILMGHGNPDHRDYWVAKLTDFGLSTDEADGYKETMSRVCGTPDYTAPEILKMASSPNGTKPKGKYSSKVDIWSLGAILYTMLSGRQPFSFKEKNTADMLSRVLNGKYSFNGKHWKTVGEQAMICVCTLMDTNPETRPTASACLKVQWIVDAENRALEKMSEVAVNPGRFKAKGSFRPIPGRTPSGTEVSAETEELEAQAQPSEKKPEPEAQAKPEGPEAANVVPQPSASVTKPSAPQIGAQQRFSKRLSTGQAVGLGILYDPAPQPAQLDKSKLDEDVESFQMAARQASREWIYVPSEGGKLLDASPAHDTISQMVANPAANMSMGSPDAGGMGSPTVVGPIVANGDMESKIYRIGSGSLKPSPPPADQDCQIKHSTSAGSIVV
mmetsp:Transcript_8387/g.13231  ORF Transcript_8387/g.13231 Transcript_8387/m.13231 type:complete len:536 (-) Transcript_8387:1711-3318(-)|eukprot:CAMPEP_0184313972 /NCGR_PEP_ID=MMETSP1049-20130417/69734_1 /TAXON_ID=77928 /ORGANISM="Proteomonas sulcata, Strain CCMP704" /LENGTH=535 /DNA_ID=CAMNT_0026631621 /DNA_START=31 /DNA_END=1638 /DNA_ORIENTATION=-